jgi:hypothetical protein
VARDGKFLMRILVVSHDAGGAEVVSSWVKGNSDNEYSFVLQGPAEKIFEKKLKKIHPIKSGHNLKEFDLVLTATSWASNLEKEYIIKAKTQGVKVVSYLDHWVNYLERFQLRGGVYLPDEIWAGDSVSYGIATNVFSDNVEVKYVENQYFSSLKKKMQSYESKEVECQNLRKILYICEPIIDHVGADFELNEFCLLEDFLKNIINDETKLSTVIKVRLHPSEFEKKYQSVVEKYPEKLVSISNGRELVEDFQWADDVVGISSMAMMAAHMLNKKVYTLPFVASTSYYSLPIQFPIFSVEAEQL